MNDDEGYENNASEEEKASNTIMQQINNFSLTPMNDALAEQTIEDHKYLLEKVENKCAIAFFAVINRNLSLFNALNAFEKQAREAAIQAEENGKTAAETHKLPEDIIFEKMMLDYDFMSVVMYPQLKNRREFVHDCWIIAKSCENEELKVAVSNDQSFYLTRDDLLILLRTHDNKMITHILKSRCKLMVLEDVSYKLIAIKG